MGQATSKRRSYTPGNSEKAAGSIVAKSSRTNGDIKSSGLANGSIEVRSSGDHDSTQIEADDPTSPTSVTSDTSTGRKETKRKRFRVSGLFSLKRTPSGKWPRRRKTASSAANGTRPMSCPDPQSEASGVASPARPQSLFLEELDINEDDNKIETVDLSDHEQDGKARHKPGKASGEDPPKAPPKTKGKRGSKKQSSLKKKKQEKKNSKKEKKSKSKQKGAAAEPEESATSGAETESPPSPSEVKTEISEKPDTSDTPDIGEELIPCLMESEERGGSSSLALGLTQQVMAHIDAKSKKDKTNEPSEEANKDHKKEENEEDLDAVASSIVAETMNIAQKRLGEEDNACEDPADLNITLKKDEEADTSLEKPNEGSTNEHKEVVIEEMMIASSDILAESTPLMVKVEVTPTALTTQESAPSPQAPPRRRQSATQPSNTPLLPSINTETEVAANASYPAHVDTESSSEPEKATDKPGMDLEPSYLEGVVDVVQSKTSEKVEEHIQEIIPDTIVGTQVAAAVSLPADNVEARTEKVMEEQAECKENVDVSLPTEPFKEAAVDVGEEVAAVSASVAALEGEVLLNGTEEDPDQSKTDKEKVKPASVSSDSDKQSKTELTKEKNEKKRLEKERLKREREAEKERLKEEKRKKAEQKSAEKEKSKGEKKIKVPKRLSSLFHKKEKQAKTVVELEVDPPSGGNASSSQAPEPVSVDVNLPQEVETMVCPAASVQIEEAAEVSGASEANCSLDVDVSVEPLSVITSPENGEVCADNQPTNGDLSSTPPHSPLESPLSEEMKAPGSDTSEPTSPGSDGDVNGSSGVSNILKKISLGPRLRTAILRKKSSGASDSGSERTVPLTTPKSVAGSSEKTPPPRKLRPRKPVEQYSPVTPGAHNPAVSIPGADENGLKLEETFENTEILAGNLGVNVDSEVKDVAADVKESITEASNDADLAVDGGGGMAKINAIIDTGLSQADTETEHLSCDVSITDKDISSEPKAQVTDEASPIDNVLNNVTSKTDGLLPIVTCEDISKEEIVQQVDVSQSFASNVQNKLSEVSGAEAPSLVVDAMEASIRAPVSSEIHSDQEKIKDTVSDIVTDIKDSSDTDDTDPSKLFLQMPSTEHQQQSETLEEGEKESEISSTLQSPTLVSTATIVLRPSSVDDTCPEADTSLEEVIEPVIKKVSTTSSYAQTTYVKSAAPIGLNLLSNVSAKAEEVFNSPSAPPVPEEDCLNTVTVEKLEASSKDGQDALTEYDGTNKEGKLQTEIDVLKDVATREEEQTSAGPQEKQIYTAVCVAQVYSDVKEDAASENPVEEEPIIATSKPRKTITIAEYRIGTFEDSQQNETAPDVSEEDGQIERTDGTSTECEVVTSHVLEEVAASEDSFLSERGQRSVDCTLTEDTSAAWSKNIDCDLSQGHCSSEESGESGQQTPTPSGQQETIDSVINGIVDVAVNEVLQGKYHGVKTEDTETPLKPGSDLSGDQDSNEGDSSADNSLGLDSSSPTTDDSKHDESVEVSKDIDSVMVENSVKPSPTETIEAYLKLQYQEGGEGINTPFVNGDKGFEENGNVLITTATAAELVVPSSPDELQQMTG